MRHVDDHIPSKTDIMELARVNDLTEEEVKDWFDCCAERFVLLRDGTIKPESELDCAYLNHYIGRLIEQIQHAMVEQHGQEALADLSASAQSLGFIPGFGYPVYVFAKGTVVVERESPSVASSDVSSSVESDATSVDASSSNDVSVVESDVSAVESDASCVSSASGDDNSSVGTTGNIHFKKLMESLETPDNKLIDTIFPSLSPLSTPGNVDATLLPDSYSPFSPPSSVQALFRGSDSLPWDTLGDDAAPISSTGKDKAAFVDDPFLAYAAEVDGYFKDDSEDNCYGSENNDD